VAGHRGAALLAVAALLLALPGITAADGPGGYAARTRSEVIRASADDADGDGLTTAFETLYGLDPNNPDSNGNGIRDGAEDRDHDGLSNAGEQRFGTDPTKADSDGNGIDDWHEDSDHDGIPDGREQDARSLPDDLTPSLADARSDLPPSYAIGCHTKEGREVRVCVFGDPQAMLRVVLFGDSHAAQWLAALDAVGKSQHWQILSITKSACPPPLVTVVVGNQPLTDCDAWRRKALVRIAALAPDAVILAGMERYDLARHGVKVSRSSVLSMWRAGLGHTLDRLHAASPAVLLLGETPRMVNDAVSCLTAHREDISACDTSRAAAINMRYDALDGATASAHHALYRPIANVVCPYRPCPIIIDSHLIYRDAGHITATYSLVLAPAIRRVVLSAIPSLQSAP
jgi:hypothetical protein